MSHEILHNVMSRPVVAALREFWFGQLRQFDFVRLGYKPHSE